MNPDNGKSMRESFFEGTYCPAINYMFKVNNRNTRTKCENRSLKNLWICQIVLTDSTKIDIIVIAVNLGLFEEFHLIL